MSGAPEPRPRRYRPADREGCLAVFDSNVPLFFRTDERAAYGAFLDALPGPYVVLDGEEGGVVACGGWAVEPGGRTADLCWGMVRRELHGRGLGRLLTEARVAAARDAGGVDAVALETSHLTTGFYRRLGFEVISREEDGYGPGLHRCRMRRSLHR